MNQKDQRVLLWLLIGLVFGAAMVQFLYEGQFNTRPRTQLITREADPFAFWGVILVLGAISAGALYKAWLLIRPR